MHGQERPQRKPLHRTLLRWTRSRLQRTYEWQFSPLYWSLQQRWQSTQFWFGKQVFAAASWFRSKCESASISREILRIIAGQALWALLLVGGLALFEQ